MYQCAFMPAHYHSFLTCRSVDPSKGPDTHLIAAMDEVAQLCFMQLATPRHLRGLGSLLSVHQCKQSVMKHVTNRQQ